MHTELLPLLRRMSNLEELTLNLWIDDPQTKHDLLVHLPRLSKFTFHIHNDVQRQHLPPYPLSEEDIQRSFAGITKQPVPCILAHCSDTATCRTFSLSFISNDSNQLSSNVAYPHLISLTLQYSENEKGG